MEIQAICVELHKAARSSFDAVLAKHSMEESESAISRLNHRKIMKSLELRTLRQLLKCAEDDLRDAQDRYRGALDASRDSTPDKCPRHALPPEIIQYIISLAYDNETLKASRSQPGRTGARSLALTHAAYPLIHNFLLSSTTLQVDFKQIGVSELPSVIEHLKHTLPLKLEVILSSAPPYRREFLSAFLQCASRMKSLTLCHCRNLDCFIPVLPYLKDLTLPFDCQWIGRLSPNWTKINQVLQESGPPKLRSSTLPSYFLAGFTSSGFLRNVIGLCIYFEFDGTGDDGQCPALDQCPCTLSQLQKLTSLELNRTRGLNLYNASSDKCYGFASLKRLQLTFYEWKDASQLVSRFSACDLKEISFRHGYNHLDIDVFACTLSDTFPRLGRLQIPTTEVHKLLRRGHGDNGNTWNFPLLHTLDFRDTRYRSKEMFKLIDVLRDRAGPEAHTLGVVPINCLFIKGEGDFSQDDCELAHYALVQLVPNVLWLDD